MITRKNLTFLGWGVVGKPHDGIIVAGPFGASAIDVTGYNENDYWREGCFLGPDCHGITPIHMRANGAQYPAAAKPFTYLA